MNEHCSRLMPCIKISAVKRLKYLIAISCIYVMECLGSNLIEATRPSSLKENYILLFLSHI